MTPTIALARAELIMLARNRTAAVTAVAVPLAGGLWITIGAPADTPLGSVAGIAAFQLLAVVGLTVVTTATTTLVARRQQYVLRRWRTSPAATSSILAGTLAPVCLLLAGQVAVLFAATAYASGSAPAQPALLALSLVLAGALACGLAFVTAAFTRTVEAANVTILPALGVLVAGGVWAMTADGAVTWPMRATGGGALAELVRIGWDGPAAGSGLGAALAAAGPSVLVLSTLTAAAMLAALRTFRWSPRG